DVDLPGQVATGDRGGDLCDVPDLPGQVVGHRVDVVGQILPGTSHVRHGGLATEDAFRADLAGDAGDFPGERGQRVHHCVDSACQRCDLALGLNGDLLAQVTAGDRGGDLGDGPDLRGEVGGHHVDVAGQVFPGPGYTGDDGLPTELAVSADLAGDPGDLTGERRELVDHRVDGLLQLGDLPARVDADLLAQVASRDRGGDLGDRADLSGKVGRHHVHGLGQVFPCPGHSLHGGLAAEPSVGADLPGDAGDLVRESG